MNWFMVSPDSKRLDLALENQPMAIFKLKEHAEKWAGNLYGAFYLIKKVEESFVDDIKYGKFTEAD